MRTLIGFIIFVCCFLGTYSVSHFNINGQLKCGQHAAMSVLVRLWNNEKEEVSQLLGQANSDQNGTFAIKDDSEQKVRNAILTIHHDCDDGVRAGRRKFKFIVPDKYFTESEKDYPFNLGSFNLETRIKHSESRVRNFDRRLRF